MNAQWFDQYGNVACRSKTYKCNAFLRERERERERERDIKCQQKYDIGMDTTSINIISCDLLSERHCNLFGVYRHFQQYFRYTVVVSFIGG
jgi:hypothetical protein